MTSSIAGDQIENDFRYCQKIASNHYENFSVISSFIPRHLRPHFSAIYAFCRGADDLGDEFDGDRKRALKAWRDQLDHAFNGTADHPIFRALTETIRRFNLNYVEFDKLIKANELDQEERTYLTIDDTLEYCRHSADPVGRLVLGLFDIRDSKRYELSDSICTGLQLANFLQDTADDLRRGRAYWPQEDLEKFGLTQEMLIEFAINGNPQPDVDAISRWAAFEAQRIQQFFDQGALLERMVPPRLGLQLQAYRLGGEEALEGVRRQRFNPFVGRPQVTKPKKALIMARIVAGSAKNLANRKDREHAFTRPRRPRSFAATANGTLNHAQSTERVSEAYRICTGKVRKSGSSFYYGMRMLPAEKRAAIFAVYAWSRICDDAVDDFTGEEAIAQLARAERLYDHARTEEWDESPDLVSVALGASIRRFHLSDAGFKGLLRGMRMDLEPQTYQTYEELENYCIDVAGAVGVLCVEIFGYRDEKALQLAAKLGVAMQLTNIIRDLTEDSERGRCYIPVEDMRKFDVSTEDILSGQPSTQVKDLLSFEAERAEQYYQEAADLFDLIDPDSLRCLKLLYGIYHLLLQKIRLSDFDVWTSRTSVSSREALQIMGGALWHSHG